MSDEIKINERFLDYATKISNLSVNINKTAKKFTALKGTILSENHYAGKASEKLECTTEKIDARLIELSSCYETAANILVNYYLAFHDTDQKIAKEIKKKTSK